MAKQTVAGISGVLGGLISAAPLAPSAIETPVTIEDRSKVESTNPTTHPDARIAPIRSVPSKVAARRGRPPGRATGSSPRKAKVTLRVDASLMDDYREWSWAQRCQLGELVERALANYRRLRA
jgi:hypothetical protein